MLTEPLRLTAWRVWTGTWDAPGARSPSFRQAFQYALALRRCQDTIYYILCFCFRSVARCGQLWKRARTARLARAGAYRQVGGRLSTASRRAQAGCLEGCVPSRRAQEERGCPSIQQVKCHGGIRRLCEVLRSRRRKEACQCYRAERLRCSLGSCLLTCYRPRSWAASAAALSARLLANTRFLACSDSSAWMANRLAVSYWFRAFAFSAW